LHRAGAFHEPGERYVGKRIKNLLHYFQARLIALAQNVTDNRPTHADKVGKLGGAKLAGFQQFADAIDHRKIIASQMCEINSASTSV
jgi:hypothetical protein